MSIASTITPATPQAVSANRDSYVARAHTLREPLKYLEREARRILASPTSYSLAERRWAEDMVASSPTGVAETREEGRDV